MPAEAGSHAAFLARRRFGSLDGLRCLCILAVLWHHSPLAAAGEAPFRLLRRGFLGVDFFFVLSGFLITTLLLREAAATGRFSLRGFYWRRALRILPAYLALVTVVSVWVVLIRGQHQYAEMVPFYYLFLANFLDGSVPTLYPLWSLSVEEQYYLLWPLLLALLPRPAVLPALLVGVALNLAGILGLFGSGPQLGPLHLALPNATYAPILIGSALAVLLDRPDGFAALRRLFGGRAAPLWTGALVLVLAALLPPDLRGLPNLALHLAMAACLASLVLREDHLAQPLLRLPPLVRIGEISYGLYLYHLIGLHLAGVVAARLPLPAGPWTATLLYLVLSVAIAELSFRTLEAWFQRWRPHPPRAVPATA